MTAYDYPSGLFAVTAFLNTLLRLYRLA